MFIMEFIIIFAEKEYLSFKFGKANVVRAEYGGRNNTF